MSAQFEKGSLLQKILKCVGFISIPLVVGGTSALITGDAMNRFGQLVQPPLSPPAWLFPIAWTILYILMGIASFLIWKTTPKTDKAAKIRITALIIYASQLVLNFFWSIFFFNMGLYFFAFVWLMIMWGMILALILLSRKISKTAAICLIPYLLWTTFAAYLNIMIAILN